MKCVLRLIRSDLAVPGKAPPDNRVSRQACHSYNRHFLHNPLNRPRPLSHPKLPNPKNLHYRHSRTRL